MKIVDRRNGVNEIVDMIISKARYQKVVFCLDKNSDSTILDKVCELVGRNAIIIKYYYDKKSLGDFFNIINNGVRIVVYDVSVEHFYYVRNSNIFLLNIFMPQSDFLLPYISNVNSMYGENVLITNLQSRDYYSILLMYGVALDNLWGKLLNYVKVDTEMFKQVDELILCDNFHNKLLYVFECLKNSLDEDYVQLTEGEACGYILMRMGCILQMLQTIVERKESYVDFYKYMQSAKDIDKAYQLLVKSDMLDVLRLYCNKLIKVVQVIINRIKIIINKYLNNKIGIKKYRKIINNVSNRLNVDNLLYIAYILNCV